MTRVHSNAPRLDSEATFFVVACGESRSTDETGNIQVKVSGADTGGAFMVVEVLTAIDSGAPLHLHHIENEWFYVLDGASFSRHSPGARAYTRIPEMR
jgi:mannose-6-phosphate isomerase-like protein (cupin superfamily)